MYLSFYDAHSCAEAVTYLGLHLVRKSATAVDENYILLSSTMHGSSIHRTDDDYGWRVVVESLAQCWWKRGC